MRPVINQVIETGFIVHQRNRVVRAGLIEKAFYYKFSQRFFYTIEIYYSIDSVVKQQPVEIELKSVYEIRICI